MLQPMIDSITKIWSIISAPLLNLVYGLVLLLVGLVVAKVLQWLVVYVLKAIQLDKGAQKIKLTPILQKGDLKKAPSDLLGSLVYWVVILVTVFSVPAILGLRGAEKLLIEVLKYIPGVLVAALVLGVAMFLAALIAGVVLVIANNAGLSNAKPLARIIQYAVIIFGFVAALGHLGISSKDIMTSFSVIIGAVGLAFAIAFGLGCKDIAADFLTNLFKNK